MPHSNNPALQMPADECEEVAHGFWAAHHLLEDLNTEQVTSDLSDVLRAAEGIGATTLGDIAQRATSIVTTVTGVTNLTQRHEPDRASHIHRAHNSIAALLTACNQTHNPAAATDGLFNALPLLAPLPGGSVRPLTDDEVLLSRSHATMVLRTKGSRGRVAAVQFALTDAGARPSEATQVTPEDFDDHSNPTQVDVPGVNNLARPRTLPLNLWAQSVLADALASHRATHRHPNQTPLGYRGHSHPHSASASASGVLTRSLRLAGIGATATSRTNPTRIRGNEPAATSITRWRVAHTLDNHGQVAALKMMGRYDDKYLRVGIIEDFLNRSLTLELAPTPADTIGFRGL